MPHFLTRKHLRLLERGGEVRMAGNSGEALPDVRATEPTTWQRMVKGKKVGNKRKLNFLGVAWSLLAHQP